MTIHGNRNSEENKRDSATVSDKILKEQALKWVVTLTSGEANEKKIEECRQWRNKSQQHEQAFQNARKLWLTIGNSPQLHSLDTASPDVMFMPDSNSNLVKHVLYTHRYLFVSAFSVLCFFTVFLNTQPDVKTGYGQIETIDLIDKSRVTLNTNSALDINISSKKREIILDKGEVYFEIAKNNNQNFIIKSDKNTIIVNGSVFNIQKSNDNTTITLVRGNIIVNNTQMPAKKPNTYQQIIIKKDKTFLLNEINENNFISWIDGKLQFKNTSIQDILNILKNYDKNIWIISLDQKTKNIRLNTSINIKDIDSWIQGIGSAFGVKVKKIGPVQFIYSSNSD